MPRFEDAEKHIFFADSLEDKVLHAYVDGSFDHKQQSDRHNKQAIGVGWAVGVAKKDSLVGYGMAVAYGTPTPNSAINELRSIIAFLKATNEYFPHLTGENAPRIIIYCDNQTLISVLVRITESSNKPTLEEIIRILGKDYHKLSPYLKKFNLTFRWVKGHADNQLNQFADLAARRMRSIISSRVPMHTVNMLEVLRGAMSITSLIRPQDMNYNALKRYIHHADPKKFYKSSIIWVDSHQVKTDKGNLMSVAYYSNINNFRGQRLGHFLREIEPLEAQLRAVRTALDAYMKDRIFNPERSLVIRVESDMVADAINAIMRGSSVRADLMNNVHNVHEVNLLRKKLDSLTVLAIHDGIIARKTDEHGDFVESLRGAAKNASRKNVNAHLRFLESRVTGEQQTA